MIELTAEVVGVESVRASLGDLPDQVRARVRVQVRRLGLELLRKVKSEKLSGQVLKVRTGLLRRSINEQTTEQGDRIESAVGTNVVYGRFWELGFRGLEQVKAHTHTLHGVVAQVRAYSRRVNQGPRPFLRPALDEMRDQVVEQLTAAATGV